MKKIFTLILSFIALATMAQQRVVAECSVTFSVGAEEGSVDKDFIESLKSTSKTVYIKGNDSRTDLASPSFSQSLFYNKVTGAGVILREFGGNKFMTKLDNAKWLAQNIRYDGSKVTIVNETKTILGYECKKAMILLKDGSSFAVYYATNIVPSVKEFEYQFKDIPGFVLEYEAQESDNRKIKYTATKLNLNPVQASRFDVPTSGYRLLN